MGPVLARIVITSGWEPKDPAWTHLLDRVGLAQASVASIGKALWVTDLMAFNVAGLAGFAHQGWWLPTSFVR